ncbi:putative acyltransferase [Talaromyces proteolyticus]|uniref:Acyltransferase n=1 Tax=Talaromyces proteolyticus TaxID=1131652 RepID=A0AAD4KUC5_9EURO|nr:putative acyltransferase [Talaromyces proteolyticus]KAH8700179.1 putative acyltransferase [Talaromyces proteolyticus]
MTRHRPAEFSLPEVDAPRDVQLDQPPPGTTHVHHAIPNGSAAYASKSIFMQRDEGLPEYAERIFSQFLVFTVPSYLQHLVTGGDPDIPKRLHDIAALDGLRGWACLLVFNFHFFFTYTWDTHVGWGFNKQNFGVHKLPIIHLLFSGHIMVAIFFVISGYVLSYRPLKTIRNRSFEQTFTVLSSATFRRGFRLYVPSIVGMFCVLIAIRLGLYNYSDWVVAKGRTVTGTNEQNPIILRTTYIQLWDFYGTLCRLVNFWDWGLYYNNYNPHLWTIPVEFRSSIVLFVTILATCRFTTKVRLVLEFAILWFCMRWGRWEVVLFLSGLLLAEIDLINGIWNPSPTTIAEKQINTSPIRHFLQRRHREIWMATFVLGLYIGSSPNIGYPYTPGFVWLTYITPAPYPEPHRFPQTVGAVLIVASINNCKPIQKIFVNPLSQYLGQISYAFYIVHGPILHGFGFVLMYNIWGLTGRETNLQFLSGAAIGWSICLPIALWLADIFWRAVDLPSVKMARQLENRLLAQFQS